MGSTQEVIVRFLRNLGSRKEVEQYLKLFSSVDARRFAVIRVEGAVLQDDLETLASALTFIQRVGLTPVVIHGAGPQLSHQLRDAGIDPERVDGVRVTTPQALEIARKVFIRENLRLVEALESVGTRARPVTSGIFEARLVDKKRFGLVGDVTQVHTEAIDSALRSGHMPIIASLGETPAGQILHVNSDVGAAALARALEPFKVVFLTHTGGLLDQDQQIISAVNIEEDYADMLAEPWLDSDTRTRLQAIKELLDGLPRSSSVSITSPENLVRELFTHKGAGTLVRRGEHIRLHESMEKIDRNRLAELLEQAFGRKLTVDYFTRKDFYRVYLSDSYRATAILTLEDGIPYLDKFAVTSEAQGEGIASSLWHCITRDNKQLFWRSRLDNEINGWYFQKSDGSFRTDKWVVFWYGIHNFDTIRRCVELAKAMPPTLKQHSIGS
ncbi:MAG: acetylglutamate kinase [Deltaproteobacteria bacterium]|nr:acetylglutamate kinase [Deltaproteobacteria bacterium]